MQKVYEEVKKSSVLRIKHRCLQFLLFYFFKKIHGWGRYRIGISWRSNLSVGSSQVGIISCSCWSEKRVKDHSLSQVPLEKADSCGQSSCKCSNCINLNGKGDERRRMTFQGLKKGVRIEKRICLQSRHIQSTHETFDHRPWYAAVGWRTKGFA